MIMTKLIFKCLLHWLWKGREGGEDCLSMCPLSTVSLFVRLSLRWSLTFTQNSHTILYTHTPRSWANKICVCALQSVWARVAA